jgi:hypothetical protein
LPNYGDSTACLFVAFYQNAYFGFSKEIFVKRLLIKMSNYSLSACVAAGPLNFAVYVI